MIYFELVFTGWFKRSYHLVYILCLSVCLFLMGPNMIQGKFMEGKKILKISIFLNPRKESIKEKHLKVKNED